MNTWGELCVAQENRKQRPRRVEPRQRQARKRPRSAGDGMLRLALSRSQNRCQSSFEYIMIRVGIFVRQIHLSCPSVSSGRNPLLAKIFI